MIISHAFAGVITTKFVSKKFPKYPVEKLNTIYAFGILASVMPDFDLIVMKYLGLSSHHGLVSHMPLTYLVFGVIGGLILLYLEKVKDKDVIFAEHILVAMLINSLVHILLDTIAGQIRLLGPVYDGIFQIIPTPLTLNDYIFNLTGVAELLLLVGGTYVLYKYLPLKKYRNVHIQTYFWLVVSIISIFIFL